MSHDTLRVMCKELKYTKVNWTGYGFTEKCTFHDSRVGSIIKKEKRTGFFTLGCNNIKHLAPIGQMSDDIIMNRVYFRTSHYWFCSPVVVYEIQTHFGWHYYQLINKAIVLTYDLSAAYKGAFNINLVIIRVGYYSWITFLFHFLRSAALCRAHQIIKL